MVVVVFDIAEERKTYYNSLLHSGENEVSNFFASADVAISISRSHLVKCGCDERWKMKP